MMNRPYIICHMQTSLDGKVTGPYMRTDETRALYRDYQDICEEFQPQAWLIGRVTVAENFALGSPIEFSRHDGSVSRQDFIAEQNAERYLIAIDAQAKLRWNSSTVQQGSHVRVASHVVEILTENVADDFLEYLQAFGISYIFAGKEKLDLNVAMQKLKTLLNIERLMLQGGGYVNGSFINANLVDELSLILSSASDGRTDTPALFSVADYLPQKAVTRFSLKDVRKLPHDGVYLNYIVKH
ncbi:RibD family protein [Acinetobacter baumannii]|nr:RibD family protein [Acinetobacter baumannii]